MEQAENVLFLIAMIGYALAMAMYFLFLGIKRRRSRRSPRASRQEGWRRIRRRSSCGELRPDMRR